MTLNLKISTPKTLLPNTLYPAVFLLHGMGSDPDDIFSLFEPLKEKAILIAFQGPIPKGPGYAYFEILRIGYPELSSFESILVSLKASIEEALSRYPIDPKQLYMAGFSQGAILSMSMAARYGSLLKGIAALHGYVPAHVSAEKVADLQDVHVFIGHGQQDPMFNLAVGKANAAFFMDRSPEVTFKTYPSGHWVDEAERNDVLAWFHALFDETHIVMPQSSV